MHQIPIKAVPLRVQPLSLKIWRMNHPLWQLGFRPFYLVTALFSAIAVPLWVLHYLGWMTPITRVDLNWHMHEMVFGMALGAIIGFLFTAAKNWTDLWTPRTGHLVALVGLWLAGRLAMVFAPPGWAAIVDLLFIPCAAWPLYRVLKLSGNRRNYFLIGLLGLLTLANVLFHASVLGWTTLSTVAIIQAAIFVVVLIESVIGARVIPMFTRNGAPGVNPVVHASRDKIALTLLIAASVAWVTGLPAPFSSSLALLAASALMYRLYAWQSYRTLHVPLLWILHLSYAWIPIGFLLLALAGLNLVPVNAAFHALTVGSMAGLILGMMTRTSLGHTGRKLLAGKFETAIYSLIQVGAVARVFASLTSSTTANRCSLIIASVCWTLAFVCFVGRYGPYLFRSRIDGKDG